MLPQLPRSLTTSVTFFVNTDLISAIKYGCPHKVAPTRVLAIVQMLSWFYQHGDTKEGTPISTRFVMALTGLSEKPAKEIRRDMVRIGLLRPAGLDNTRCRLFLPGKALEDGLIDSWVSEGREKARQALQAITDASQERLTRLRESKAREQAALDEAMGY